MPITKPGYTPEQISWRDIMRTTLIAGGASESRSHAIERLGDFNAETIQVYYNPALQKIYVPDSAAKNLAGLREVSIAEVAAMGAKAIV